MPPSPQPPVLLLERTGVESGPAVDVGAVAHRSTTRSAASQVADPSGAASLFRAPGLALLAAVSVLEGYRWFGVITNEASRPWAVVFAMVAVVGALALTRRIGRPRRSVLQRLVVATALAAALATALVLWNHDGWAAYANGTADLALAATALVTLVTGERSRRQGDVAA